VRTAVLVAVFEEMGSGADHARPEVRTWKISSPFDPHTGADKSQRAEIK